MSYKSLENWESAVRGSGNTLCISYGKDSLASLGAIKHLGWKLDRIVHVEVWATDTIPADLPPMVEFKAKADEIIKKRFGIEVEHIRADVTYEECFYRIIEEGKNKGRIYGFPYQRGAWCNSRLKMSAINKVHIDGVEYIGIAEDEPKRFKVLRENKLSPLKEIGWDEDLCGLWCQYSELLSPTYCDGCRNGCWFCHNQPLEQLRFLRKKYPHLWALLLKWDNDSPTTFKANGRTVHDYEERFRLEDEGYIFEEEKFRWGMLEEPIQIRWRF